MKVGHSFGFSLFFVVLHFLPVFCRIMSVSGSQDSLNRGCQEADEGGMGRGNLQKILGGMRVPLFKGDSTRLQDWIESIEKNKIIYGLSDGESVLLAFEATAGPVSKSIRRWIEESPGLGWEDLKNRVIEKYASVRTEIDANRKLLRLKQESGETPSELGERATELALLAYPEEAARECKVIQAQLVDLYVDALQDDEVRNEILRGRPARLADALELARDGERFWDRSRIRKSQAQERIQEGGRNIWERRVPGPRGGRRIPQEISEDWEEDIDPRRETWSVWRGFHNPPPRQNRTVCWTCKGEGHRSVECPTGRKRQEAGWDRRFKDRPNESPVASPKHVPRNQGYGTTKVIRARVAPIRTINFRCWNCGQPDHMSANCPHRKCWICDQLGHVKKSCPRRIGRENRTGYRKKTKCWKCFRLGHIRKYCFSRTKSKIESENCDSEAGTDEEKYLLSVPMSGKTQGWSKGKKIIGKSKVESESCDSETGTDDERYLLPVPISGKIQGWRKRKTEGKAQVFSLLTGEKQLTCRVRLGKIKVEALIDSGASVSLISKVVYDRLKTWNGLKRSDLVISQASGKDLTVLGMTWLPLRVGRMERNHKLYVVSGLHNKIILGKDWLGRNRAQLTFNPPMLSVGGVEVSLGAVKKR